MAIMFGEAEPVDDDSEGDFQPVEDDELQECSVGPDGDDDREYDEGDDSTDCPEQVSYV